MKQLLLFISLFTTSLLYSQSTILSGKIINGADNTTIAYCSVGVLNTGKTVLSNELGEFSIKVNFYDTLIFSMLGFENKQLTAQQLMKHTDGILVHLTPKIYELKEVAILAISPQEIIKRAIGSIKNNYPTKPTNSYGYYRETCNDNNQYTRLVEAAVSIYDPGYSLRLSKLNEKTRLLSVRSSYNFSSLFTGLKYNGITELYNRNMVKYVADFLNEKNFENYNYRIDSVTVLNENPVYVISFSPKGSLKKVLSEGNISIRKKDYAIFEVNYGIKANAKYWPESRFNDTLKWNTNYIECVLKFVEHDSILYLNYVSKKYANVYYKKEKDAPDFTSITFSELMVNEIQTEVVKYSKDGIDMDSKHDLFRQKTKYDSAFWNNYNIIKDTPLQEKIKKDLEKKQLLHQQYNDTGVMNKQ
jgi:hypothetical protein